ncbi:MAG: TIGR03557 family F420-dependent LLM class oxidoreductase [Acidimicrobiales bacterium]
MSEIGLFITCEEHSGSTVVDTAQRAEAAGFSSLWVSDHFHPWMDSQGESPFVWSVLGALASTTNLTVTTAVTCPIMRIHPVILAQAAATTAEMMPGRFRFGIGTGEALNEHVLGDKWPIAPVRLEMIDEAVALIRRLWTGESVTEHGRYYTCENARIYTLPDELPPIPMSAYGPKAIEVAASIADGLITTSPSAEDVAAYREAGGTGITQAGLKVCWGPDEDAAKALAHERWAQTGVPGQLSQDLPTPTHFEQAVENVTVDQVAESIACGPDPEVHVAAITEYLEAGFDEVYVCQAGPDQQGFLDFYVRELAPRLGV